jgi:pimeloyl-ACP methyl ester carboxylesterase
MRPIWALTRRGARWARLSLLCTNRTYRDVRCSVVKGDRNWELLAPFEGAKVTVPALYMVGDRDLIVAFPGMDRAIANLANNVPQLRGKVMLADCGHLTQ